MTNRSSSKSLRALETLFTLLFAATSVTVATGCELGDADGDVDGFAIDADDAPTADAEGFTYATGIGSAPTECAADYEKMGALCAKKCPDGFWPQVSRCIRYCNLQENGGYQSSAGVCAAKDWDCGGWEHNSCSHFFQADSTDRGAAVPPQKCVAGMVMVNGLCYTQATSWSGTPSPSAPTYTSQPTNTPDGQVGVVYHNMATETVDTCLRKGMVWYTGHPRGAGSVEYYSFCVTHEAAAQLWSDEHPSIPNPDPGDLPCEATASCSTGFGNILKVTDTSTGFVGTTGCMHPRDSFCFAVK